jgi:urease accessory protein
MELELVCGQSAVTSVWSVSPLRILAPRPRGPSVYALTSTFGGGLLAGDETALSLHLGKGTRCFLGTQSSTKIYRNPDSKPCGQLLHASRGAGAFLVLGPDPVQPFKHARYQQRQEFHLADGSGLVVLDWLSSGRSARGERWMFSHYQTHNEVSYDGKRVVLDSLLLNPEHGELSGPFRLGRFNCLATVLVLGSLLQPAVAGLLEDFAGAPVKATPQVVAGASPIHQGALLRFAGENVEAVGLELRRRLSFLIDLLGEDPWARKY